MYFFFWSAGPNGSTCCFDPNVGEVLQLTSLDDQKCTLSLKPTAMALGTMLKQFNVLFQSSQVSVTGDTVHKTCSHLFNVQSYSL